MITDGNGTRLPVVLTANNRDSSPSCRHWWTPQSLPRPGRPTAPQTRHALRKPRLRPLPQAGSAPEASCPPPHVHSASGATGGTPDPGSIALLLCWMISWT